jgi:hypothetical protein
VVAAPLIYINIDFTKLMENFILTAAVCGNLKGCLRHYARESSLMFDAMLVAKTASVSFNEIRMFIKRLFFIPMLFFLSQLVKVHQIHFFQFVL